MIIAETTNPMQERLHLDTLTVAQLTKKFPTIFETESFIILFTTAIMCSCNEPDKLSPIPLYIPLPPMPWSYMWVFRYYSPTQSFHAFIFRLLCVTRPALHFLLYFITLQISAEEWKPWGSSSCSFLQPPVTSSISGPHVFFLRRVLIHPQYTFFPSSERLRFATTQNNRQSNRFLCYSVWSFKNLKGMVASIRPIQSAFTFFLVATGSCDCHSEFFNFATCSKELQLLIAIFSCITELVFFSLQYL